MARVFVTRRLPLEPRDVLGADADVVVFPEDRPPTRDELFRGAADAEGLVCLLSERVDGTLLDRCPALRVVANVAVGHDNIDLDAVRARGIVATNTPDVLTEATAELTWALILAVARRVIEGDAYVRGGRFTHWSPTLLLGTELSGRTLGIFGRGRIGDAVARRAAAFGMDVVHTSRSSGVPFEYLLDRADVLSIHAPLNEETRHAFDDAAFARMRRGAILVNTARGPIVDEAALVRALEAGRLGGAGLDVYEDEPRVHPDLLARDDVVLLPHVGSATTRARRAMARLALENVAAVLAGRPPKTPVP